MLYSAAAKLYRALLRYVFQGNMKFIRFHSKLTELPGIVRMYVGGLCKDARMLLAHVNIICYPLPSRHHLSNGK